MSVALPIQKHTVGRTFTVAITVLGIGALAQFGAVCWLFMSRYTPVEEAAEQQIAGNAHTQSGREFADPFESEASIPAAANLPAATPPPKPTPIPQQPERRAAEPALTDRLSELIEQGKTLRERGDTYASVTKLREAEAMAEGNPVPTTELAMTYEKMGFNEKAAECWKRIYELGPSAGVYFTAAEGRLKQSQAEALREAAVQPATQTPSTVSDPAVQPAKGEIVGLNASCKLGLKEIVRQDETDAAAKRKFVLKVPVRAKPRARIDVHDVIVQVAFYDMVNEKALDRTSAQVNYKWSSPPADWADDDVEVLEVSYMLPELRVSDEDRKYYGYIATIYYKNALQDFRSEPAVLAQRAPPAATLAQDTSP